MTREEIKDMVHQFCDQLPGLFKPRQDGKVDRIDLGISAKVQVQKFDHSGDEPKLVETVEVDYQKGTVERIPCDEH